MPLCEYIPANHNQNPLVHHQGREAPLSLMGIAHIFMPGCHYLPQGVYDEIYAEGNERIQARFDELRDMGVMIVTQEGEGMPSLQGIGGANAIQVIRATMDLDLLEHWKKTESVAAYREILDAQIAKLTPSASELSALEARQTGERVAADPTLQMNQLASGGVQSVATAPTKAAPKEPSVTSGAATSGKRKTPAASTAKPASKAATKPASKASK